MQLLRKENAALRKENANLRIESRTDALTGVGNRNKVNDPKASLGASYPIPSCIPRKVKPHRKRLGNSPGLKESFEEHLADLTRANYRLLVIMVDSIISKVEYINL